MKLKSRAAVLQRLHLLIQYSDEFLRQVQDRRSKYLNEFPINPNKDPEDKMLVRVNEYAEELCNQFCILWPQDKSATETVIILLRDFIMNGGVGGLKVRKDQEFQPSVKMNIGFKDDTLHITIKSPVTKKQLIDFWPTVSVHQEKFLFGSDSKDAKEVAEYMFALDRAKLAVGRDKTATEYRKLKKRHDERYAVLGNKYMDTPEFERNTDRLHELGKKIHSRDIFRESPKVQLDEDLHILRLYREHGQRAEDEYRKVKLKDYIVKQDKKISNSDLSRLTFPELLIKYCPKWKNLTSHDIDTRLRIKNFSQRLEEIMEAFCLK